MSNEASRDYAPIIGFALDLADTFLRGAAIILSVEMAGLLLEGYRSGEYPARGCALIAFGIVGCLYSAFSALFRAKPVERKSSRGTD